MVKRFEVFYPLANGTSEKRTAYIYLPESYQHHPERRYPVLYMFDGHNVFFDSDATYGKCWGMQEYMDRTKTDMIIAAIECNHHPNNGRLEEYSPFTFRADCCGYVAGRGKNTMEWMVNTFKRIIDSNYRTLPDRAHTYIAGSSMGGLMSLYALMEYNHVFSKAAALSPSLWTFPVELHSMLSSAPFSPDTVLYMDYGSEEFGNHKNMRRTFGEIATLLMYRKLSVHCRIVPGGTHCEASWEKQIPFFMETFLYS
jgi:predicted alpha/beta superfamily hydrolase